MFKYNYIFSYRFLMNLRLVFGNYYDLRRSPNINVMTKLYCILFGVLNIVQMLSVLDLDELGEYTITYQLIIATNLVIVIALPLLVKADEFFESSLLIRDIDDKLGLSSSDLKSYIPMSILTIGFFVQCLGLVYYYRGMSLFSVFFLVVVIGAIRFLTLASSICPLIIKLDWCRNRLKILRKILKDDLKTNNQEEKTRCVKMFIRVYKSLSKYLRVTEKHFSVLVLLNIVINIFKILIFICYLIDPYFNFDSSIIVIWASLLSYDVFVQFVPALLMELSANELDAIKATLADELIECDDNELRTVLYDALDYIEVRPATFNLWPNFPMNLNLVLRFIGLCSTYTISFLQFKY